MEPHGQLNSYVLPLASSISLYKRSFMQYETNTKQEQVREKEAKIEMGGDSNGSSDESFVKMPTIKFTKLFINGEFIDSVSGTSLLIMSQATACTLMK